MVHRGSRKQGRIVGCWRKGDGRSFSRMNLSPYGWGKRQSRGPPDARSEEKKIGKVLWGGPIKGGKNKVPPVQREYNDGRRTQMLRRGLQTQKSLPKRKRRYTAMGGVQRGGSVGNAGSRARSAGQKHQTLGGLVKGGVERVRESEGCV